MQRSSCIGFAIVVALHALAPVGITHAGDSARDHEIARQAVKEGRIRPLADITATVKPKLPGEILGVEVEIEKSGRIVYEFDVITPDGKLQEVDVDPQTAEILSIEDDD